MAVALRTLSRTSKTTKIDPQKDPRYRRVVEQLKAKASKIKQHPSPARKAAQAAAAAKGPLNEKKAGAKANQVDKIKEAKEKKPEPSSFLTLLRAEIEKAMPKTLGDTEKFMKGGTAEELKGSLKGNVGKQKEEATGDVKTASKETPSEAGVTGKEVTPIPGEPAPASPVVAGAEAMPAPKPDAEISLQESKADTAQAMKDAEVTDTQLQRANDPRFSAVLSAKGNVAAQADKAPAQYRASEQASLSRAATVAGADARKGAALMVGVKSSSNSAVLTRQQIAKAKDEAARKKVADDIEAIYNETKTRVEQKLGTLEGEVSSLFDNGTTTALKTMKESVETRLERYKRDRYGFSLTGVANWTRDLFMGLPEEVNEFYVEARKNFTLEMDALIVRVANLVETRLKEAKQEVAKGQERIKLYVAALPQNLQSVGKSAQKEVADRFSELERGIEDKKNQLAEQLASKYKDASDKAEAALKVIQDANKGLVQVFAEKLGEVLRILKEFKEKVMVLVRKAEETIKLIVADPIRFLGNLLLAVKKGINQFVSNIATHLKTGFFNWLFGTLAKAGITMPKDSSLPSILKLVLDVLGITYDKMRVKAVKLIGERNVAIIEKVGALISFLISGGLTRLWEMAKESLGNIKETIMEMIRGSLITQIIQSAVVKLLSMFNPAGAIIQAITIIYDTIMFFVDNIDRILDFAKAVIDSIYDVVTGSVDKAANWIEKAMGKMVPILIGFLARLIGLGGISDKIKVIIIKLQERVDKAIDKIIEKVVASVKKLFGKLTGKKDERTEQQKQADLNKGLSEADNLLLNDRLSSDDVRKKLPGIRAKYRLKSLSLIVASSTEESELVYVQGENSPPQRKPNRNKNQNNANNITKVSLKRSRFQDTTKWIFQITFPELHKQSVKPRLKKNLARRHIISSETMIDHYESELNKLKWSAAATKLQKKNLVQVPTPLSNENIEGAAKAQLNIFFNDVTNLFIGDARENSRLQGRTDIPDDWDEKKWREHLRYIKDSYALNKNTFNPKF